MKKIISKWLYKISYKRYQKRKQKGSIKLTIGSLTHGHISGGTHILITGTGMKGDRVAYRGKMLGLRNLGYCKDSKLAKVELWQVHAEWENEQALVLHTKAHIDKLRYYINKLEKDNEKDN